MLIPSDQIPQADVLSDVLLTAESVKNGARTYQDIARYIGKVGRQGRYYRKAAEIIGLINNRNNHSVLTQLGTQILNRSVSLDNPLFIQSVLKIRLFQRLLPLLEANSTTGLTRTNIIQFIFEVSDLDRNSMAPRRVSSVVAWLVDLNIIEHHNNRYYLIPNTINENIEIFNFSEIDEPILPRSLDLSEYQAVSERAERASDTIITYRNQTAIDRADNAHRRLVNLVADRIKQAGIIPRYNQLIDLATRHNNEDYIFEMKSITDTNARGQVRRGLSQLYEYQYLQNLQNSNLVLVIERRLPESGIWMIDYLEQNRGINLIWDGDEQLYGTEATREKFNFLNLTSY